MNLKELVGKKILMEDRELPLYLQEVTILSISPNEKYVKLQPEHEESYWVSIKQFELNNELVDILESEKEKIRKIIDNVERKE